MKNSEFDPHVIPALQDLISVSALSGLEILYLPLDWTPKHWLSISLIREIVEYGVGLYIPKGLPAGFDLSWLDEQIGQLPVLWIDAGLAEVDNLSIIEEAVGLREIVTPFEGHVDLSGLESLREAEIRSDGYLSALRARSLTTAIVHLPVVTPDIELSRSITSLSITSGQFDSRILGQVPQLRDLAVYGAAVVDLLCLPADAYLDTLVIADCRILRGLERFTAHVRLRSLKLFRVSRIDEVKVLPAINPECLDILHCPDVTPALAQQMKLTNPAWTVASGKKRGGGSRFERTQTHDGKHEVIFDDWEWVEALIDQTDIDIEVFVPELEAVLKAAADSAPGKPIDFCFDSEAGSVIAVVSTRADATRLRKLWDGVLSTPKSLQSALIAGGVIPR